MPIKIDPEFRDIIPPLTKSEFDQLEKNLIQDGCREKVITWNDYLIDGHNRYEICEKNKIPYEILEMNQFAEKSDAISWMIQNQIGKRNLTTEMISYLRGVKVKLEKEKSRDHTPSPIIEEPAAENSEDGEKVGPSKSEVAQKKREDRALLAVIREHEEKIADEVAKMYHVEPATLKKDEQFASAMDTLRKNVGRGVQDKILTRELKINAGEVVSISKMEKEKQQELMAGADEEILARLNEVKQERKHLNQKNSLLKLEQKLTELNGKNKLGGKFALDSEDDQVYFLWETDGREVLVGDFKGTGKIDTWLEGFAAALTLINRSDAPVAEDSIEEINDSEEITSAPSIDTLEEDDIVDELSDEEDEDIEDQEQAEDDIDELEEELLEANLFDDEEEEELDKDELDELDALFGDEPFGDDFADEDDEYEDL